MQNAKCRMQNKKVNREVPGAERWQGFFVCALHEQSTPAESSIKISKIQI